MSDMEPQLPADLRFLKALVTVLTAVMILGVITIVAVLVTRLPGAAVDAPEALAIPPGTTIVAVTRAPSFFLVTTDDDRLLVFDVDGSFRREVSLD